MTGLGAAGSQCSKAARNARSHRENLGPGLPLEDCDLVTQHQDLHILVPVGRWPQAADRSNANTFV